MFNVSIREEIFLDKGENIEKKKKKSNEQSNQNFYLSFRECLF